MSAGATDEVDPGHQAGALRTDRFEEEPGDGFRLGCRIGGDGFRLDGAAILVLPERASGVGSYLGFLLVVKGGFGSLEDPSRSLVHLFAGVDLHALGGEGEERMLPGKRGGGALLLGPRDGCEEDCGEEEEASHSVEQFT